MSLLSGNRRKNVCFVVRSSLPTERNRIAKPLGTTRRRATAWYKLCLPFGPNGGGGFLWKSLFFSTADIVDPVRDDDCPEVGTSEEPGRRKLLVSRAETNSLCCSEICRFQQPLSLSFSHLPSSFFIVLFPCSRCLRSTCYFNSRKVRNLFLSDGYLVVFGSFRNTTFGSLTFVFLSGKIFFLDYEIPCDISPRAT